MNALPAYTAAAPFAVSHGHVVEGLDCRTHTTRCCRRSADEHARYLRARGAINITVTELRDVPVKGAFGGWRVSPGAKAEHKCELAPTVDVEEWYRYAND